MMSAQIPHRTAHSPIVQPVRPSSPWHSPVPYLFGGLAAMLGLIAFALLILACSYWKLSGYLGNENHEESEGDVELGEGGSDEKTKMPPVWEPKFLVIMAGQEKPTFLATLVSSLAPSFTSNYGHATGEKGEGEGEGQNGENTKEGHSSGDHDNDRVQVQVQSSTLESRETTLDQGR